MALAAVSVFGFILRWNWRRRSHPLSHHRVTRTLPHLIDTLFLASGIGLAVMLHVNPLQQPWLAAKIVGLVAYILLGFRAMAAGRGQRLWFLAALAMFAWIVSVARSRDPWGYLAPLLT